MDLLRVKGLLGLAARAGVPVYGEEGCVGLARRGKAALMLVDEGLSQNGMKRYRDACRSHQVKLAIMPKGFIADATGRNGRMAAAFETGGFCQQLAAQTGAVIPN